MKRILSILVLALFVSGIVFAGGSSEKQELTADGKPVYVFKVAQVANATTIQKEAMNIFLDYIDENSNGQIRIERYLNGELAQSVEDTLALLSSGAIQCACDADMSLSWVAPEWISYTSVPFCFREKDHMMAFFSSDIADEMNEKLADFGLEHRLGIGIADALQKQVQDALAAFVEEYRDKESIPAVGSAVVIDVKTGGVLACATYPSYDLSTYYDNYAALAADTDSPLWNRALLSTYAPGSTMKPAIAVAGLEEGVITETSTFRCTRYYTYFTDTVFRCTGYHGSIDVKEALNQSCNIFFYETGRLLGIERMNEYCSRFGLGQKTGVEVGESTGVLASIEYRESHGGTWYPGDTVQAAIGQSDNLFTPIQLANYAAALATGTRYQAHFVKSIKTADYSETILENTGTLAQELNVSDNTLRIVREGMRRYGARISALRNLPVAVAAKSGTAESKAKVDGDIVEGLNGFMISFAPYEDPEIAVAVAIENLNSGTATATLVAQIYEAYFAAETQLDTEQGYNSVLG